MPSDAAYRAMAEPLAPGDVVQLDPAEAKPAFRGCFLVVEKVQGWGVIGYVPGPHVGGSSMNYYRAPFGSFRRIGAAHWLDVMHGVDVDTHGADPR